MFDYTTNSSTKESKEEKKTTCMQHVSAVRHSNASTQYTASGRTRQPQPIFFLRCEGEMKNDACVHVTGGLSKMAVGSRADGLIGTVIKHAEMCSNVRTVTKLRRHSFLLKDEAPPKLA